MSGHCLLVIHSHWRIGGVRAVIGRSLPAILRESGLKRAILVSGEPAPSGWLESLRRACSPSLVHEEVFAQLGYVSEMAHLPDGAMLRNFWRRLLRASAPAALWWHNPALGRNVPAVEALLCATKNSALPILFHHHDLWCDHRWKRWPEMRACGYRGIDEVARILFATHPAVSHITINSRDDRLFHSTHGRKSRKLGNPFDPPPRVGKSEKESASAWLRMTCAASEKTPLWLAPSRLLRRKNILESLLLLHRFCPEAILVTSNFTPSADEERYAQALREVASRPASRLRMVGLDAPGAPGMAALHAAAEALVQSSLQEGFGLLFSEAAWAQKPLLCRRLPNVWPDLLQMGMDFPLAYDECLVELPGDVMLAESRRQKSLFHGWKKILPEPWQALTTENPLSHLFDAVAAPFSKLTLHAQLRALECETGSGRRQDFPALPATGLPGVRPRSSTVYAGEFLQFLDQASRPARIPDEAPERLQTAIARDALAPQNLFPLLIDG